MLRKAYVLIISILALSGCDTQDTDRLARVGKLTLDKIQSAAGNNAKAWPNFRPPPGTDRPKPEPGAEPSLEERVSARLRWDKGLAETPIAVSVSDGKIELKGKLKDEAQRRRAVELAEATAGVGEVVDSLEVQQPGNATNNQ
jgi:hypothetical protein